MAKKMSKRYKISIIILGILIAILILPSFNRPWIGRIRANRYYAKGIEDYDISCLASRKVNLPDGNSYYIYFESTNRFTLSYTSWMITIIWTSDGEKYEKVEAFDYNRSRIIGDKNEKMWGFNKHIKEGVSVTDDIMKNDVAEEFQGLFVFKRAKNLSEVKEGLVLDGFKITTKP